MKYDLVFENYDVNKYLSIEAVVFWVNHRGIDKYLIKANEKLCSNKNIPMAAMGRLDPKNSRALAFKFEYNLEKIIM